MAFEDIGTIGGWGQSETLMAHIASLVSSGAKAVVTMKSLKSGSSDWKAQGAAATNSIEGAMDKNRLAFISGLISITMFEANYSWLWNQLVSFANEISSIGSESAHEYAERMVGDRQAGGKFGAEWQGFMHDDNVNWAQDKMDSGGYILTEFQVAWSEKERYMEVGPINLGEVPTEIAQIIALNPPVGTTGGTEHPGGVGGLLGGDVGRQMPIAGAQTARGATMWVVVGLGVVLAVVLARKVL